MNKIIITVGAPGSGKSTWVENYKKNNPDVFVLSSDALRAVFGSSESDQSVSAQVFRHMENEANNALKRKQNVLIDATNMHLRARKPWVDIAKENNVSIEAYVFLVDRQVLIERNQNRGLAGGRNVPVDVIDRMLTNYVAPSYKEGFGVVRFVN